MITLRYFYDVLGSNTITSYKKIGLSLFLVDSEFSSPNNYIYARTSNFENVLPGAGYLHGQFDFEDQHSNDSPFNHLGTEEVCGTAGTGTSLRLHTAGCSVKNFYVFVTGFRVQNIGASDPVIDLRADLINDPNVQASARTITPNTDTSSNAGFIYK